MAEPQISITRVFAAPRERVWREWTEPDRFADWFGGGDTQVPLASVSMDVRKGGAWRATMLVGPGRLVFTLSDRPDEVYTLVTVVLTDLGDGRTEMRFSQRGGPPPDQWRRAKEGWSSFFDRIQARLAAGDG